MPCSAGLIPSAPGMNTDVVLALPAFITSSAETSTKMAISMAPSTTPVRVEARIPRGGQRTRAITAHRIAIGTHRYSFEMPKSWSSSVAP